MNYTSTDTVVSLTEELDASDLTACACTELLFTVFAIGSDPTELSSFNVKGRYTFHVSDHDSIEYYIAIDAIHNVMESLLYK